MLVVALLGMVLGCLTPANALAGVTGVSSEHRLPWDGVERHRMLCVPAEIARVSAVTVVMMHGGGGDAGQAERGTGGTPLPTRKGSSSRIRRGGTGVDAGSCCGRPAATGVDDVGFIEAMVQEIASSQSIDPARVYATGMSNGAMMAYRLACQSTTFAAIAPVAGTMMVDCGSPARCRSCTFTASLTHMCRSMGAGEPDLPRSMAHRCRM